MQWVHDAGYDILLDLQCKERTKEAEKSWEVVDGCEVLEWWGAYV